MTVMWATCPLCSVQFEGQIEQEIFNALKVHIQDEHGREGRNASRLARQAMRMMGRES